jgi:hypothetical protein
MLLGLHAFSLSNGLEYAHALNPEGYTALSCPVSTPYLPLLILSMKVKIDCYNVFEALLQARLAIPALVSSERHEWQDLAALRVDLCMTAMKSPDGIIVSTGVWRRSEQHTTYWDLHLLGKLDPVSTSLGVGICIINRNGSFHR